MNDTTVTIRHSPAVSLLLGLLAVLGACASPSPQRPAADPTAAPHLRLAQQEQRISTDRPGFSDGAALVPVGRYQAEGGVTYVYRNAEGIRTNSWRFPEVVLRTGISETVEFRVGWSGYAWSEARGGGAIATNEGFTDLTIGTKIQLHPGSETSPALSALVSARLGTGSAEVSNRELEPLFKVIAEQPLADNLTGFANFGVFLPKPNKDHLAQWIGTAGLNIAVQPDTDFFVELAFFAPNQRDENAAFYFDTGVLRRLSNRLQLDASFGIGLNGEADDFFTSIGLSYLF